MATTRNNGGPTANRPDVENRLRESVRKAAQRPEAPASGYCWDAFISYHRDPDFDRWMTKVFSILQKNLANYLGGQAKIFIDVRDIELGDRWTDELKDALRTSKCLIPFIEPAYFASQWCTAEFDTFRTRKNAPITPLAIHPADDPRWIPISARVYQRLDIEEYHLQTLAFGKSERATELEIRLRKHAASIARKIAKAPPFRDDFRVVTPDEPTPTKRSVKKASARRGAGGTRHEDEARSHDTAASHHEKKVPVVDRRTSARPGVFVNTPFSETYRPVFDAIVFTILSFGYYPQSVLDGRFDQPRLHRVLELIGRCSLGLHDLSEPAMNTVLELGMFMATKRFGVKQKDRLKDFLVVMPEHKQLQLMISDLAGIDVVVHNMEPQTAMLTVANWLATRVQTRTPVPSAASVWNQYRRFRAVLPRIVRAAQMSEKDIAYYDVVLMISEWLEASGTRS
jgi:hypothetical protein